MQPSSFRRTSCACASTETYRLRAALDGTHQVQGALLASTATTVAIFLPVLFLQDVEGQLFADLALTIAIAVCDIAGGRAHHAAHAWRQLAQSQAPDP